MSLSVGSTGALLAMIAIALWIWRRGERPIRSGALQVALVSMIVGILFESAWPVLAAKAFRQSDEGCWLWGFVVLNAGVHALAFGAFVGFILGTIAPAKEAAPANKN